MPLLALFLPLQVAAPLAVLLSITIAAVVVVQDWREIHFRSAMWLLLATLPGIPCGLLLLTSHHQAVVKAVLGAIILAFSVFSLCGRSPQLERDRRGWLLACGFCAGLLGGAYGMNGPPLVVYGTMRRWTARHFRATLQAYFLPASVLAMTGYWFSGLWVPDVTRDYLLHCPSCCRPFFLAGPSIVVCPDSCFSGSSMSGSPPLERSCSPRRRVRRANPCGKPLGWCMIFWITAPFLPRSGALS